MNGEAKCLRREQMRRPGLCLVISSSGEDSVSSAFLDLRPTAVATQVDIRDLSVAPEATRLFSVDSAGTQGNLDSLNADVTGDGRVAIYHSLASNLLGANGDMNGLQDIFQSPSPQGPFIRGDANLDAQINVSDSIYVLNWLFQSGPPPGCYDAADADDSGAIVVPDVVYINSFLFQGGPPPACPFCCSATTSCCGKDPTGDGLPCGVTLSDCTSFSGAGQCP